MSRGERVAADGVAVAPLTVRRVIDQRLLRSAYQPIVELDSGRVIGHEALARGPQGTALHAPVDLFGAAAREGIVDELEWDCRRAAVVGASSVLPDGGALFVNVEPSSLRAEQAPRLRALADELGDARPVVLELTERAISEHPARMLEAVAALRAEGFAIALDDVGVDPGSIALLPFVRPDVIKLDLGLLSDVRPGREAAAVVHAVTAAAERSEALVVAEGIETARQQELAVTLGARHGQGYLFGRPSLQPSALEAVSDLDILIRPEETLEDDRSPFEFVSARIGTRVGKKASLLSISRYLEHFLAEPSYASVLLATLQHERNFTPATRERYRTLGEASALVAAFGEGMADEPVAGVRGVALTSTEQLAAEWDVAVVTPHLAAAFVSVDLGDEGVEDFDRRFEYCLTYDRSLALAAARKLMRRLIR